MQSQTAHMKRLIPIEIEQVDLDCVCGKILDHDEKEAKKRNGSRLWDRERAEQAVADYRRFLALMLWYPDSSLVPSEDIDEVWHTHILNLKKYLIECDQIFGHTQFHFPTFGESEEVLEEHVKQREQTMLFFKKEFGEIPESYEHGIYLDSGGACYGCTND